MTLAEQLRVGMFLGFVVSVYVLAAGMAVRRLVRGKTVVTSRGQIWRNRVVLTLAAVGMPFLLYGRFIEPYRLTVSHVRIDSARIPAGFGVLRIAHVSDIHSDAVARLEDSLPQAIAAEHPDLIVFTGDTINSPSGIPVFKKFLTALTKIAPTFVVKGNWDSWYWPGLPLFEGTGARELDGTAERLVVRDLDVWVSGIAADHESAIDRALDAVPPGALTVFLAHYPDFLAPVSAHGVDLYCAGHTHGGQVALPGYGALVTFSRFGKAFEAGLYRDKDTWLYVNRGIGMEGGVMPRVRFWAPPELTILELQPKAQK